MLSGAAFPYVRWTAGSFGNALPVEVMMSSVPQSQAAVLTPMRRAPVGTDTARPMTPWGTLGAIGVDGDRAIL